MEARKVAASLAAGSAASPHNFFCLSSLIFVCQVFRPPLGRIVTVRLSLLLFQALNLAG